MFHILLRVVPLIITFLTGIWLIDLGYASWHYAEQVFDPIIHYQHRRELIWFINIFIGLSYYFFIAKNRSPQEESKYLLINTSFPLLDSILTVVTYASIVDSTFVLVEDAFAGNLSGLNFGFFSLFTAIFILLWWCIKRLLDMSKEIFRELTTSKRAELHFSFESINSISYSNSTLQIDFSNGTSYQYFKVPLDTFKQFKNSESKGKFLNEEISGKFSSKKMATTI